MKKKSIIEEAKAEVKKAKKENKDMNSKKLVIKTVLATLLTLITIGAIAYGGFLIGRDFEASQNTEVQAKVEASVQALTAAVEAPSKK